MEGLQILGPGPRADVRTPTTYSASTSDAPALAALRYRASHAAGDLDVLLRAGEAARRAGGWQPGAATSREDWELLCDVADSTARYRKR
jgi:hypothetical protein